MTYNLLSIASFRIRVLSIFFVLVIKVTCICAARDIVFQIKLKEVGRCFQNFWTLCCNSKYENRTLAKYLTQIIYITFSKNTKTHYEPNVCLCLIKLGWVIFLKLLHDFHSCIFHSFIHWKREEIQENHNLFICLFMMWALKENWDGSK